MLTNLTGHSNAVIAGSFSPDSKTAVTGSEDNSARVWNAVSGEITSLLFGHTQPVRASISPDGSKIITSSLFEKITRTWDLEKGIPLYNLSGHTGGVSTISFSPSQSGQKLQTNKVLTASMYDDNILRLWDITTGKLLLTLEGHKAPISSAVFSPDESLIATSSYDSTAIIWDAKTGVLKKRMIGHNHFLYSVQFSPDGKKIITGAADETAKIWDVDNGIMLFDLTGHRTGVKYVRFNSSGSRVITVEMDGVIRIFDPATGKFLLTTNDSIQVKARSFVSSGSFSADNDKIIIGFWNGTSKIWNIGTGKLLAYLRGHKEWVRSVAFSKDGKKIITASEDQTAGIWESISGKLLFELKGHDGPVLTAQFTPDGDKIITTSMDNTCRVWGAEKGELRYTFFSVDSIDYFVQLPSGFYQGSTSAAKRLHYITRDLKVITFEQLDVKYNRPDKVLEALGNRDTVLIESYKKAWEKRIRKLGIDTSDFRDNYSVPECDIVNREELDYEQKTGTLRLHIKGMDSVYKLDRFNIWVNESPLFGQRGISVRRRNTNKLDTVITIKLSQGDNQIESSIININGTESYRIPLFVNYTPAVKQKETTRFVGIGIDEFTEAKYNLQFSTKDIRDLAAKLKEKYKNEIIIDTLFNKNVTVSNVKALKQRLRQTTENDKVIIAYSGHGLLSKDFDYYLSTYPVNFDKPEESGLPYDELENLLDSIPARKKLMFIDACHSGEVDKEDLVTLTATSDSLIKGLKPVAYKKEGQLGLKNSFELMQSLFVNVGKSTGATIISAAAGTQFALERGDLKNGVFTYSILEAMNKYPTLKISELKKIVGERVEQLTNGMQKPTSRNETIAVDWQLW